MIEAALNPSDPSKLHPELVGLVAADQYLQVTSDDVQAEDPQTVAWALLALSICIFTFSVWWFFLRSDKQGDTGAASSKASQGGLGVPGQSGWVTRWNPFDKREHHKMPYDPEELSIGPSFEGGSPGSQDGDQLLGKAGRHIYLDTNSGRPVYMGNNSSNAFDPVYEDGDEPEDRLT